MSCIVGFLKRTRKIWFAVIALTLGTALAFHLFNGGNSLKSLGRLASEFLAFFLLGYFGIFGRNYSIEEHKPILKVTMSIFLFGVMTAIVAFPFASLFLPIGKYIPDFCFMVSGAFLSVLLHLEDYR